MKVDFRPYLIASLVIKIIAFSILSFNLNTSAPIYLNVLTDAALLIILAFAGEINGR